MQRRYNNGRWEVWDELAMTWMPETPVLQAPTSEEEDLFGSEFGSVLGSALGGGQKFIGSGGGVGGGRKQYVDPHPATGQYSQYSPLYLTDSLRRKRYS